MAAASNFKPFPLLVTGAPGWLADAVLSRLGDALPALSRVRCLVQAGHSDENLQSWRRNLPGVTETFTGDLLDEESLRAVCENMRGGVVLHCAALFHPRIPADWFVVNRDGTVRLAEIARNAGVRRFVFISSIAAQGESRGEAPLTEELACRPFSAYGRSKLEAEEALLRLHMPGQFEAVVIRPCQFYGPPVPPHHVAMFQRVASGTVQLVAGGRIARSLSYIDDLAGGVVTALHHPKAAGTVFNLCDAHVYSEREIIDAVAQALNVDVKVASIPALSARAAYWADRAMLHFDKYNPKLHLFGESHRHGAVSCAKAQQILGFEPKVDLHEGMRRSVAWARGHNLID